MTGSMRHEARREIIRLFPDGPQGLRQAVDVAVAKGRGESLAHALTRAETFTQQALAASLTMGERYRRLDGLADRAKARLKLTVAEIIPDWEDLL